MDGVATAEGPHLRVGRRLTFCVRPSAAPHPQKNTLDTREALDSQHSTTSCAAYAHYALCNRTMCLMHSCIHAFMLSCIHSFIHSAVSLSTRGTRTHK